MCFALELAREGLGSTAPNPSVGCVIVKDGAVVGAARTCPGGRPHAETEALAQAGERAKKAVVYLTLEPCAHEGETQACVKALIDAGVARVVSAMEDPDERVRGRGHAALRKKGVEVTVGVCEEKAEIINAPHRMRVVEGRPLVTLKMATSLDGRIATKTGESRWITDERARVRAHILRSRCDAVMVGSETALTDDPELLARLPGLEGRPRWRVIVDTRLRLSPKARLFDSEGEVWIVTGTSKGGDSLRARGATIIEFFVRENGIDMAEALKTLAQRGVGHLLVEGGGKLAASLLREGLVDRLAWFYGPLFLGAEGRPCVGDLGLKQLCDAQKFKLLSWEKVGDALFLTAERV